MRINRSHPVTLKNTNETALFSGGVYYCTTVWFIEDWAGD
jgi:hypothetical protein